MVKFFLKKGMTPNAFVIDLLVVHLDACSKFNFRIHISMDFLRKIFYGNAVHRHLPHNLLTVPAKSEQVRNFVIIPKCLWVTSKVVNLLLCYFMLLSINSNRMRSRPQFLILWIPIIILVFN